MHKVDIFVEENYDRMSSFVSCCIENSSIMDTETEGVNLSGASEDEESWVNDSGIRIGGMGGM